MSKFEDIIQQMEDYLAGCKPKTFSANKIDVDKEQMEEFLEELRTKCPDEVRKAQKVVANRNRILEEANEERERMIAETEAEIKAMVNEHDIVKQATAIADKMVAEARDQAESIVASAQRDADEIRQGAIEYTDSLLANTEGALLSTLENTRKTFSAFVQACDKSLRQVRANRDELSGDSAAAEEEE